MARHRVSAEPVPPSLPALPASVRLPADEKRNRQVKIRLSPREAEALQSLRPELTPAGIVGFLVDDVLTGRYRPPWAAAPLGDGDPGG